MEIEGAVSPSEPLFCHPDGTPTKSFKNSFQQGLKRVGILYGSNGKKRVPYSLRHTYATMRLSEGVRVFQLAANTGTSVEVIEKFYGKKRVRDPKAATELTKNGPHQRTIETPVIDFHDEMLDSK